MELMGMLLERDDDSYYPQIVNDKKKARAFFGSV